MADVVAAAGAESRREHTDAAAVAKFVDPVEQIDDIEPRRQRLGAWEHLKLVRDANIERRVALVNVELANPDGRPPPYFMFIENNVLSHR